MSFNNYRMVTMDMQTHNTHGVCKNDYYFLLSRNQYQGQVNACIYAENIDALTGKDVALTICSQTAAAPTPAFPFEHQYKLRYHIIVSF